MKTLIKKIMIILLFGLIFSNLVNAQSYLIGDIVKPFELKNVNGKMVKLSDYNNENGIILIFTCNHCPYSQMYESRILELDAKYKSKGYPVVAINPNDSIKQPEDSYSQMIIRAKDYGYTFPYLLDKDQSVAKIFGATRTPHVFILKNMKDKKGFMLMYNGAIDNNPESPNTATEKYVEIAMDELEGGKTKLSKANTKAIGCTIKWADAK